jgi:helicase
MPLEDYGLGEDVLKVLAEQGITSLYPPQEEALGPALDGKNLVLAIPTASGKSLVAYLAILKSVREGGKALYIVPLRALAAEKLTELRALESLGLRVGIAVGDLDAPDPSLERYDVIVATSERADSLLRHRSHWLNQLTVVVADEVHLINDPSRGPTLEVTLAKLAQINESAQIIALSATIRNSRDLAGWLNAEHITSDWRPVPLKEGIYLDGKLQFTDNTTAEVEHLGEAVTSLVADVVAGGGQALTFVNTRRSAEVEAKRLSRVVRSQLEESELAALRDLSSKIRGRQEEPTSLGGKLADLVASGSAFHHAGLTNVQRRAVEEAFKAGLLKSIAATPTLAAGINLPARRVIIRDLRRYDPNYGSVPIPVLEVKQMAGRAGRPKYDTYGEAILLAKRETDRAFILENYLLNEPEAIESRLGTEPALRMHILASIATEHVRSVKELYDFIGQTFFAYHTDVWVLEEKIEGVLGFLRDEELIVEDGDRLRATFFGKRTSDLYIDPLSATLLRDALLAPGDGILAHLHAVCATPDMPLLYLRRGDEEWVDPLTQGTFLIHTEDYGQFLAEVKTASLLHNWIREASEDFITTQYSIGPGDIRRLVDTAEWLVHALHQLARIFNKERVPLLRELVPRVRYGVKEELLELVSLRGIGRVRARALRREGYATLDKLREVSEEALARVPTIGPGIAKSVKLQLSGRRTETVEPLPEDEAIQSLLGEFEGEAPK